MSGEICSLPLEGGGDSRAARREGVVSPPESLAGGDHPHPGRAVGASLASPLQGEEA